MSIGLRGQRVHKTEIVGAFREMRQQVGYQLAGLTAWPEFPGALRQVTVLALEGNQLFAPRHRLTVPLHQFGFIIKGVEMADRPRAKDVQDPLGPGSEMRWLGCERIERASIRSVGRWRARHGVIRGGEQPVLGQELRSRQSRPCRWPGATESRDGRASGGRGGLANVSAC